MVEEEEAMIEKKNSDEQIKERKKVTCNSWLQKPKHL